MAAPQGFQPFVPANESRPEFTVRAILLGCVFGILFGAVTVYVGLRAGLTVAASIPISVLSISVLRALGKASILENNIVQTTGNAGQSIAAGVIFTLPALIFLGFDLEYIRIFMLALQFSGTATASRCRMKSAFLTPWGCCTRRSPTIRGSKSTAANTR